MEMTADLLESIPKAVPACPSWFTIWPSPVPCLQPRTTSSAAAAALSDEELRQTSVAAAVGW